jgi:RNA polymerase sigma-70 factor (ECF subfamily)
MQLLPPRQRAALIASDVLDWPAKETASLLETSVPAVNSALQRARATMQANLPARRAEWSTPEMSDEERGLLAGFIDAHERGDAAAAVAIAARDIRITMPPYPHMFEGLDVIEPLLLRAFEDGSQWRLVPTRANRLPTAASYQLKPGDSVYRAMKLDVLRIADGRIAEITTFGPELFPEFGLAPTL